MSVAQVILDNSTLTAIERITGKAPVPQNYSIEGDYSAFENFLSTLLFYDNFYFIDDYKDKFRQSRRENFPFLRRVSLEAFPYDDLETRAAEITADLMLEIRGGRISESALTEFLDIMGLTLTAAWHMRSSDFFLTLKILSDNPDERNERFKYSKLTSLIYDQLHRETAPVLDQFSLYLESSNGEPIPLDGFQQGSIGYQCDEQLINFANSLNWLSRRSVFYILASGHFDAAMCVHPIRHNFINSLARDRDVFTQSFIWRDNFRRFFGMQAAEAVNAINRTVEATEIGVSLPLLAAWGVGKTGTASEAIDAVLELRTEPAALAMRAYFNELTQVRSTSEKARINELVGAIHAERIRLQKKFGMPAETSEVVTVQANIAPTVGISVSAPVSVGKLGLIFGQARHVRCIFRNIVNDIARFPHLGDVRDGLLRQIRRNRDELHPILPIEERRFWGRSSTWKKPM